MIISNPRQQHNVVVWICAVSATMLAGCHNQLASQPEASSSQPETKAAPPEPVPVHTKTAVRPKPTPPKATAVTAPGGLGTLPKGVGVKPGTKVSDFTAVDASNTTVSLKSLLTRGRIMIFFYRGGW